MPDDNVFRPERRPINPSEINAPQQQPVRPMPNNPGQAQEAFDKITAVQRQLNPDFQPPVTPSHATNRGGLPSDAPDHIKAALERAGANPQNLDPNMPLPPNMPPSFREAMQRQQSRPGPAPYNSEMTVVSGSQKLQEIREKVKQASYTYEEIQLPSLGRFYDGVDGPKNGILHVRPMTGHEEEILATPRLVKRGNAVNTIFNRCIEEDYDSDKFLTEDRTYLLIYLRGISYGTNYEVEVKCPDCTRTSPVTINLHELYVDQCPETYDFNCLSGVLPTTQLPYQFRLSRGDDELRIQDYREKRFRPGQDSNSTDDTLLYRTALLLDDIAGLTDKRDIQLLLKDLPINDVAHLRNIISEPPFGVDTNAEVQCPRCWHEFSLDLPLEASFFFPRGKTKKAMRSQSSDQVGS